MPSGGGGGGAGAMSPTRLSRCASAFGRSRAWRSRTRMRSRRRAELATARVADLARRAGLGRPALETLAAADAFGSLGLDRRRALWRDPRPRPGPLAAVRANRGSRAGAGRDAAHCAARRAGRGRLPHAAAVAEGAPGGCCAPASRAMAISRAAGSPNCRKAGGSRRRG